MSSNPPNRLVRQAGRAAACVVFLFCALGALGCESSPGSGSDQARAVVEAPKGERLIYVPAYNYAVAGDDEKVHLSTTLAVHNVSKDHEVMIRSVEYFDAPGRSVRSFIQKPEKLPPLKTIEYHISAGDTRGGAGANVIVTYDAPPHANAPLVETLSVGSTESGWLSFTSRGVEVLTEHEPGPPPAPLDI